MATITRKISELKPHPDQASVYGDEPDLAFIADIKANGVLVPLFITRDDVIVSGYRRWKAAEAAGLEEVPVSIFDNVEPLVIREAFISCNRQREKTTYQKACEAQVLMEVETERAKMRMAEGGSKGGKGKALATVPGPSDGGNARDKVGEALGLSGRTVADMLKVKAAVDTAEKDGNRKKADRIKGIFNTKGVKPAVESLKGKTKAKKKKPVGVKVPVLPTEGEQDIDAILVEVRKCWNGRSGMTFGYVIAMAAKHANRAAIKSDKSLTLIDDQTFLKALQYLARPSEEPDGESE